MISLGVHLHCGLRRVVGCERVERECACVSVQQQVDVSVGPCQRVVLCVLLLVVFVGRVWDTLCFVYHMSTPHKRKMKEELRNKEYAIDYHLSPTPHHSPTDLFGEGFAKVDLSSYRGDSQALIGIVRVH